MDTVDILSCAEFRQFWVAWTEDDGKISAGYGGIPLNDEFIHYADLNFRRVYSVGFSSGHGSDADWTIITKDQSRFPWVRSTYRIFDDSKCSFLNCDSENILQALHPQPVTQQLTLVSTKFPLFDAKCS